MSKAPDARDLPSPGRRSIQDGPATIRLDPSTIDAFAAFDEGQRCFGWLVFEPEAIRFKTDRAYMILVANLGGVRGFRISHGAMLKRNAADAGRRNNRIQMLVGRDLRTFSSVTFRDAMNAAFILEHSGSREIATWLGLLKEWWMPSGYGGEDR